MTFDIRRVVTAQGANGRSTVMIDAPAANPTSRRRGHDSQLIWSTDSTPARLVGDEDMGARAVGRPPPARGTVFRVIEIQPGAEVEMHRTDTIDYVAVMLGEMDMLLDDSTVHLRAGDVLVQRGTWHGWANNGDRACRFAVVLLDATR